MSVGSDPRRPRSAVIIGAGPAGLTAALEFLRHSDIRPVIIERGEAMGGISRTVTYKGNRIDIGGHRFFSRSDRVMDWWLDILPLQSLDDESAFITYHRQSRMIHPHGPGPDPAVEDRVMMLRRRKSRIYYLRQFFDYPLSLSFDTLRKLGRRRTLRIVLSYARTVLVPIRQPRNLEEFFISRFGRELYETFFKDYTEKVWGLPCSELSAEWGAQRIKGLSIVRALTHFVKSTFRPNRSLHQKGVETSLIEQFLYPKFGPGQMWDEVAARVIAGGGTIMRHTAVTRLLTSGQRIRAVEVVDGVSGQTFEVEGDFFLSTMPIRDLAEGLDRPPSSEALAVARGLVYRDFITVGLLLDRLELQERDEQGRLTMVQDNWIYIQEPDVKVGRLQIFNNWSPYMVADPSKV